MASGEWVSLRNRPGRLCSVAGCSNPHTAFGLCRLHWERARGGLPINGPEKAPPRFCSIAGCTRPHLAKGLCGRHYQRAQKGRPLTRVDDMRAAEVGTKRLDRDGYVKVKVAMKGKRQERWLREHRVVMEEHIGRPLTEDEEVHHRNADRTDNRIENLELWTRSQPAGGRVVDKLEWARSIIATYGDLIDQGLL